MNSEYWYERRPLPSGVREALQRKTTGERSSELYAGTPSAIWLLRVSGEMFRDIFAMNRLYLYKGCFTAPPDENDYESGCCFLTADGAAGFAVINGRLTSMFSNRVQRGFAEQTAPLIKELCSGLICICGGNGSSESLEKLYHNALGFVTAARTVNDSEIMKKYYGAEFVDGFTAHSGKPFHLFMTKKDAAPSGQRVFADYFEAEQYLRELK